MFLEISLHFIVSFFLMFLDEMTIKIETFPTFMDTNPM